ncbi:hypothetical protein NKG94_04895 [Micromonospora sp. M12]
MAGSSRRAARPREQRGLRVTEARDAAHEAAALYARIGAPGDQAIADRRYADLAATRATARCGPGSPRSPRPRSGWPR